jgi:hypothetical protein
LKNPELLQNTDNAQKHFKQSNQCLLFQVDGAHLVEWRSSSGIHVVAVGGSSTNDLHRPACSKQTNEKLTVALSVQISAIFKMALRVKSVDCEPNVGWEAATQGEVHRRCRGPRDTFRWRLKYVHI